MKTWSIRFYLCVLFFLVLLSYAFIDQNLIFLKPLYSGYAFSNRLLVSFIYIVLICSLFFVYVYGFGKIAPEKIPFANYKKPIVILVCLALFSYPAMLSYDIFNYMATSRVLFLYHENPYITMPIQFIGDPYMLFLHAANKTALYGPSWILISALPYYISFGNFFMMLLGFKLLNSFFYIATVWLVYKMSKNMRAMYFFAYNPLVVIETLISNHNDIAMMFLALLCFYFLFQKKYLMAAVVLTVSVFIKFATIFLLPVVVFVVLKKLRNKRIDVDRIYLFAAISMFAIFLLSPLREEMYPWYATWFLVFVSFLVRRKIIFVLATSLSFGLMLRYIPFLYLGTYFGPTPILKIIVTSVPVVLGLMFYFIEKHLWEKKG